MWSSTSSFLLFLSVLISAELPSSAFTTASPGRSSFNTRQFASTQTNMDTPETLPEFPDAKAYQEYMATVSQLPKGFATGTADGTFISVEAPGLGNLKIRATVIYLTEGPSDSWAACFTSNKVSCVSRQSFVESQNEEREHLIRCVPKTSVPRGTHQSGPKKTRQRWTFAGFGH
jgi:hypothetical protein